MTVPANILRLVALVLVQVLVLDHLDVANGRMVPYLYVLFLLMLPFETPAWAMLLIGAAVGTIIDVFSDTPGMHAGACVVMMFARIHLQRPLAPREGYEHGMAPTVAGMGMAWFLTYAGILVPIHHLWLFFAERYSFDGFHLTLFRVLLSAAFTLALCLLAQFLTARAARGRA